MKLLTKILLTILTLSIPILIISFIFRLGFLRALIAVGIGLSLVFAIVGIGYIIAKIWS